MYIIVAGGGMVGGLLAGKLLESKHDVILIDHREEVCNKLYAETGVVAIKGSATQIEVLKEAGVEKADVMVAATPSDADNLVSAILAKSLDVPQVVVRMRDPNYEKAYRVAGVNAIVRVTDLMVNQMVMEIEKPKVRRITTIGGGRANIFMVIVPPGAKVAGMMVKDVAVRSDFPSECVFVALYNPTSAQLSIPRGDHIINEGDELFFISTAEDIKRIVDFLTT
ncbi:MAG: TrkA family potassium uptake protein [Phycisphaerales bacterium]|nr:MAG: TrkA family potassium uptake protein [Phycisphaerales bacterium]